MRVDDHTEQRAGRPSDGPTAVHPVRRTAAFLGRERVTWRQAVEGTTSLTGAVVGSVVILVLWRRLRRS